MRKIIHIDMDAFYASIEQRDNPDLRGKPIAVGYEGDRGVVATASYEARKYGVKSAMASKTAKKKCPYLIFCQPRFEVYHSVSNQIMNVFKEYTDLVEPLSLDEAFLDVTINHKNILVATEIALEIKKRIKEVTSLTASAGVSFNKFLAKIASDYNKPDGLFVIKPRNAEAFVENLPIERFFGVGKVTAQTMQRIGIKNGADLKGKTESELVSLFGKAGKIYYKNARAIDDRAVNPDRIRKSIGAETTFSEDLGLFDDLSKELYEIAIEVASRVEQNVFEGRTVTLKVKYTDFKIVSRSKTSFSPIKTIESLYSIAHILLHEIDLSKKIRLLGLSIKNTDSHEFRQGIQLRLPFDENELDDRK